MVDNISCKSFLIYIPPSAKISYLLEKVNMKLRENHPSNTYVPLYKGKWHSHLMVYLSPMPVSNQNNIIDVVKNIVGDIKAFTVKLSDLEIADSNYLYVNVDNESRILLENIHSRLVEKLALFRDRTIKEKYLQKWDTFSHDEMNRIKTTGLPYKYVPHMTLGVFSGKEEQEIAFKEVTPFNLKGNSFLAKGIEVMTSIGSDYKDKEIVYSGKFPQ